MFLTIPMAGFLVSHTVYAQTRTVPTSPEKEEPKIEEVVVRAKPPPRSASDWEADEKVVGSTPHETGADALRVIPGAFVSDRGLLGRAPHLSLRGFDGTSGQDVEVFVENIPLNQASNIRAPGYADMRLVMPEVIKSVRIQNGPYDPHQGDFAIAGSAHMELGLPKAGFWGKGTLGSFRSRRIFLGYVPNGDFWRDCFAAFETYSTDGAGTGRAGERSSFIAQFATAKQDMSFRSVLAIGTGRFDFPGYLDQGFVERGGYPYTSRQPLGRDRASHAHLGAVLQWTMDGGVMEVGAFASRVKMGFHENLTGYVFDATAGIPPAASDDAEQVNESSTIGISSRYRHHVKLTSKRDLVELGVYARLDNVDQSDTRLVSDGTVHTRLVDATVSATNLAAYVDTRLHPVKHLTVRGGTRLDSLTYAVKDRTNNQGLERSAQGFHLGNKVTFDYFSGSGVHWIASYGEGFRSPQARTLSEGDRVPFATVQSFEAGVRVKDRIWQASLSGFQSWLSQDRVFDPTLRQNSEAPGSRRTGVSFAVQARRGMFGSTTSGTYTYAVFTGSDRRFREGDIVPYAPRMVLREDAYVMGNLAKIGDDHLVGRIGLGLEGAAMRELPGGTDGKNVFYVDALATLGWREVELGISGINLLNLQYYDSQYVYVSNFDKDPNLPPPSPHVLVAPPASIFVSLQIHLPPKKRDPNQYDE
ncbi:TonB-dependent receptor [Pendulispora albinea]|uniref:TonB-dependent receptor n=1 Tax=Pendulispora albinea TaxID=2741071 RepID=A0ABZ2M3B3_9BACT